MTVNWHAESARIREVPSVKAAKLAADAAWEHYRQLLKAHDEIEEAEYAKVRPVALEVVG